MNKSYETDLNISDVFVLRAKTPELQLEPEEEAEIDLEDVRLDSCKYITTQYILRYWMIVWFQLKACVCVWQITVTCILRWTLTEAAVSRSSGRTSLFSGQAAGWPMGLVKGRSDSKPRWELAVWIWEMICSATRDRPIYQYSSRYLSILP